MKNNPALILQNSRYSAEDIMLMGARLTDTYRLTRQVLSVPGFEDPMMRLVICMGLLSLFNDKIDPSSSLMSEITCIPEITIKQWFKQREAAGRIKIISIGHRDIYFMDRPWQSEVMQVINQIMSASTANHELILRKKLVA